jgi:hypothetical protein
VTNAFVTCDERLEHHTRFAGYVVASVGATMNNNMVPCLTAEAARLLKIGEATARKWADTGRLTVQRTESGVRLFDRQQLEKLAAVRSGKTEEAAKS